MYRCLTDRLLAHLPLLAVAVLCLTLAGCGGGGSDSSPPPVADGPADPPPDDGDDDQDEGGQDEGGQDDPEPPPGIVALGFDLADGVFWEYGWDTLSAVSFPGVNEVSVAQGRFRLTLEQAVTIAGRAGFAVRLTGTAVPGFALKALAIEDGVLYGSLDDTTWQPLFAGNGTWTGGGLFIGLPDDLEVAAAPATIDNDYLVREAPAVGASGASDLCVVLNGRSFCDEATTYREFEYHDPDIGVLGYGYQYDTQEAGFDGAITNTRVDVGLIAASTRGDTLDYDLEVEPNNSPLDNAVALISGRRVIAGDAREEEFGGAVPVEVYDLPDEGIADVEPNDTPEDARPTPLFEPIYGFAGEGQSTNTLVVTGVNGEPQQQLEVQDLYLLDFSALPAPARTDKPHGDCTSVRARSSRPDAGRYDLSIIERTADGLRVVAAPGDEGGLAQDPTLIAGTDYLLAVAGVGTLASARPYTVTLACNNPPPDPVPVPSFGVETIDWYEVVLSAQGALQVVVEGATFVLVEAQSLRPVAELSEVDEDGSFRIDAFLPADTYRIGVTQPGSGSYEITAFY